MLFKDNFIVSVSDFGLTVAQTFQKHKTKQFI